MKNTALKIEYRPIGIIHSPFSELTGMPNQSARAAGIKGTIEIFPEFQAGLKDVDGFSHIILLCHLHRSQGFKLEVIPYRDNKLRGLFATRAPKRPNPIGLSIVKLNKIDNNILYIENIDLLDETPVLDIKPYVPDFDGQESVRTGWLERVRKEVTHHRSDARFIQKKV